MDEKLIELVREHAEIYDMSHKKYMDVPHKTKVWNKIGDALDTDSQKCKQRWESIRAQFRKHIRAQKTKSASSRTKWKYEDQLEFLKAYMKDRVRMTSETGNNEDILFFPEEDENDTNVEGSSEPTPPGSQILKQTSLLIKKRKASVAASETASSILTKYSLEEDKKLKEEEPTTEMDLFFDYVKMTVNKFSVYDQFLTKQKIFQIVTNIESKYMARYYQSTQQFAHASVNPPPNIPSEQSSPALSTHDDDASSNASSSTS